MIDIDKSKKLEKLRGFVNGVGKDANELMDIVEMAAPFAREVVKRILDRVDQAHKIFAEEETDGK